MREPPVIWRFHDGFTPLHTLYRRSGRRPDSRPGRTCGVRGVRGGRRPGRLGGPVDARGRWRSSSQGQWLHREDGEGGVRRLRLGRPPDRRRRHPRRRDEDPLDDRAGRVRRDDHLRGHRDQGQHHGRGPRRDAARDPGGPGPRGRRRSGGPAREPGGDAGGEPGGNPAPPLPPDPGPAPSHRPQHRARRHRPHPRGPRRPRGTGPQGGPPQTRSHRGHRDRPHLHPRTHRNPHPRHRRCRRRQWLWGRGGHAVPLSARRASGARRGACRRGSG
ncbi:hypothetical protein Saa2_08576 [Streptomyces acidiscabies]|nr:hypothetical protein Saa2_08576 [Streptomyces acidiscabies]